MTTLIGYFIRDYFVLDKELEMTTVYRKILAWEKLANRTLFANVLLAKYSVVVIQAIHSPIFYPTKFSHVR